MDHIRNQPFLIPSCDIVDPFICSITHVLIEDEGDMVEESRDSSLTIEFTLLQPLIHLDDRYIYPRATEL